MNTLKHLLLVGIVALGAGLRFWGINFGLPYTYAPDEPTYLTITLQILRSGDLNPHWWYYPSAMFYLHALAQAIFFLLGRSIGVFTTLADLTLPEIIATGVGHTTLPETFLIARGLTALLSTLAILVVYAMGRRLHPNSSVAILAVLFFALSPTVNDTSHRIGPDVLAMFFLLVSGLFALRLVDEPHWQNYVGAGLGAGLAFGSKYNAGVVLIAVLVAHFSRWRWAEWQRLLLAFVATALGFFIATPFAVFDFPNFWEGLRWQVFSYSVEGHSGQEGDALRWYLTYLWSVEGWVALGGALGALWMVKSRSPKYWTLLSFPVAYFAFVSMMFTRNERTIMLIVPFLSLSAAMLLVNVYEYLTTRREMRYAMPLAVIVTMFIVWSPLYISLTSIERLLTVDGRETARVWIEQNLPRGTRIAIEAYSPYVDRERFVVDAVGGMITRSPEWYIRNGIEYLVASYGTYGRFYEDPARYRDIVARYDAFFGHFPEIKRFDDGGYQIRIYRTNVSGLPNQRVGARWGWYENWLELVGYDQATAVLPGEMLNVVLHWRGLKPRRETFHLTARLLDGADREIAQSSGQLLVKVEEITRGAWTIPVPRDAAPGLYRLELDVDAEDIGRVPVLNRFREPIADKVFIGPVKIAPLPPMPAELDALRRVGARFGERFELVGYTLSRVGDTVNLTLYWRSIAKSDKNYTVFVHLLDAEGNVRAQRDAPPHAGAYPTSIWDVGEIVRDDYALELPRDLAAGEYRLVVGWYEYPSLARVSVTDTIGNLLGDQFVLDEIIRIKP